MKAKMNFTVCTNQSTIHKKEHDSKCCGYSEVAKLGKKRRMCAALVPEQYAAGLDCVLGKLNGQKGGGIPQLSDAEESELKQEINTGRFHTAQEIIEWVDGKWQVRYKPGAIYALLRRLEMRKKVPRRQADKADPEAQAAWKKGPEGSL